MRYPKDRRGSYGMFIVAAVFAVAVVSLGYFTHTSDQASRVERVEHSLSYRSISEKDLLEILEEAENLASTEAAYQGLNETEQRAIFQSIASSWITAYLGKRGVYDVQVRVSRAASPEPNEAYTGEETYLVGGEYLVEVTG
jgi:hypothetical protein